MNAKPTVTQLDDKTVVITRTFDAPRTLVWKAWTDPKHLAQWFGPKVMTVPVATSELQPGGAWRVTMRDPNGTDYPCKGVYAEVKAPERFTSTVDLSEHPRSWFDMLDPGRDKEKGKPFYDVMWDISFAEKDGKTTVTIKTTFEWKEVRDKFVKLGMVEGWSQSFEKLDNLLEQMR